MAEQILASQEELCFMELLVLSNTTRRLWTLVGQNFTGNYL